MLAVNLDDTGHTNGHIPTNPPHSKTTGHHETGITVSVFVAWRKVFRPITSPMFFFFFF